MDKTLGILITSDRHGKHLNAIVQAARHKGIGLMVHIAGTGVRLCLSRSFRYILDHARVTVCHDSAKRIGIADRIETLCPGRLTSALNPPLDIGRCTRSIVL